jgi:hypothetical protein
MPQKFKSDKNKDTKENSTHHSSEDENQFQSDDCWNLLIFGFIK